MPLWQCRFGDAVLAMPFRRCRFGDAVLTMPFWRCRFGDAVLAMLFWRCRFGDAVPAIDVLAMIVSAMGRFGDGTFCQCPDLVHIFRARVAF